MQCFKYALDMPPKEQTWRLSCEMCKGTTQSVFITGRRCGSHMNTCNTLKQALINKHTGLSTDQPPMAVASRVTYRNHVKQWEKSSLMLLLACRNEQLKGRLVGICGNSGRIKRTYCWCHGFNQFNDHPRQIVC